MFRRVLGHRGVRYIAHEVWILKLDGRLPITTKELTSYPDTVIRSDCKSLHTTRTWVYLTGVEIAIFATLKSNEPAKYKSMFERRITNGKFFDLMPTMGPKQCMVSEFEFANKADLKPLPICEDLGLQPYSQDFEDPEMPWYYAPMNVVNGIIKYPSWNDVYALNLRRVIK
jgi:hypothetical protein